MVPVGNVSTAWRCSFESQAGVNKSLGGSTTRCHCISPQHVVLAFIGSPCLMLAFMAAVLTPAHISCPLRLHRSDLTHSSAAVLMSPQCVFFEVTWLECGAAPCITYNAAAWLINPWSVHSKLVASVCVTCLASGNQDAQAAETSEKARAGQTDPVHTAFASTELPTSYSGNCC